MEDAELVASAIAKSPDAFAALYDRYVDRIFDYARSVLRSDADAADVTQDTFLVASQRLDQLRDASRLRPWLYAIARSHAFKVIRERQRTQVSDDVDEVVEMTTPDGEIDAQQLVWAAAAGLTPSDRDILDLHLRQGLDGQELAVALGVTANVANVALHRVRTRLEQSVGAVLLAKTSKQECAELDELMADGMNPLARKRIVRHLDTCTICDDRRRAMTSPSALFAATPLALAPLVLRDRVLGSIGTELAASAADLLDWRTDGFPTPEPIPDVAGSSTTHPTPRTTPMAFAASAAVVLLAVVGVFLMLRSSATDSSESAETTPEQSIAVLPTPIPSTTSIAPPGTALSVAPPSTRAPLANAPDTPTASVPTEPDVDVDPAPPPATDPVATAVPETVPDPLPVISLIDVTCASTMQVVVDIDPKISVTGTFETLSGASTPLIVDPGIAGRFSAELAIGEGRVTPLVVATSAGGTVTLALDDCIVIG